jgi:hypothetical protein
MFYKISGNTIENMSNNELNAFGHFRIADGYVLGGDCDKDYHSPFIIKDDASLIGCAEECLKNDNCQRFSFGKFNMKGEDGLGCRISKDGKCSVTIDRFKKEKQEGKKLDFDDKLYGLNFYNGQLYDKLSPEEIEKVKTTSKSNIVMKSSSSSKSIINNNVVSSEEKSKVLEIVDGKIVKNEVDGIDVLDKEKSENQEESQNQDESSMSNIFIVVGIIILILIIVSVYFIISKNRDESN